MSISGVAPVVAQAPKVYATKLAILQAVDLKIEEITIPEWGNITVRIRGLMGYERDSFEQGMLDQRGKRTKMNILNARARLCALCIIDEEGRRVFEDEDVHHLGMKSAAALDRVYDVASKLSGISDNDLEELAGELKNNPNGVSSSN